MSVFIRHEGCPSCGPDDKSQDNLAIYEDNEHCFACGYHKNYNENRTGEPVITETTKKERKTIRPLPESKMPSLRERNLDSTTINKYKVTVDSEPASNIEAIFPRFDDHGNHVGNQIRFKEKDFRCEGNVNDAVLFGQQCFPEGGRSITITEGYYDTLSAFQLTGSRYPNVGVMSASTARKEIVRNFEYLNTFERIVINFDSDEPGQKAAKDVAQLFAPGKVHILKLAEAKDANDYLMKDKSKEYVNEWFRSPAFMPDGIQLGSDPKLLEEVVNYVEPKSVPYPWDGLNQKLFGIRTSELVLLTADTGVGKTSVIREIEYQLLTNPEVVAEGHGVGFLHLEEPKRDLALGLISLHKNKPYHFPDVERTTEELTEAYKEVLDNDRVVIWDHFGSNDIEVVLAKIRHMHALGCKYIMVDHLSIIVSDQRDDERKQLDEISTKIKTLTMNLDIAVFCVIHVNRQGQVRGSAGPEQVANCVMRLERDKKELNEWRRNITRITIEKNRKFGRTGPACWLYYNEMNGRLEELTKELAYEYENGGNAAGHEFDAYS